MFDECRHEGKMGRQLERQVHPSLGEKSLCAGRGRGAGGEQEEPVCRAEEGWGSQVCGFIAPGAVLLLSALHFW